MENRIKVLRESRDMTVEQLAEKIGVDSSVISSWEDDTVELTIEGAMAISEFFNVPVAFLVCQIPDKTDETSEMMYAYRYHPVLGELIECLLDNTKEIKDRGEHKAYIEGWCEGTKKLLEVINKKWYKIFQ